MKLRPCECSIVIATRNRRDVLFDTLGRLTALPDRSFEIVVCDNGSTDGTLELQTRFPGVRWLALAENHGSAARNVGAAAANGWLLLMLDDDSWPAPGVVDRLLCLFRSRLDLGAAGLRVRLAEPPHRHDAGGVPGIFFNCGGAVRRKAFLEVGGFPIDFDYYAEEYDLCARLWQAGWTVEPRGELVVWHLRAGNNRDADRMLRLLVRNNLRFWRRYAPDRFREQMMEATLARYQRVAAKENARVGYRQGLEDARAIPASALRQRPLTIQQFERLMGIDQARGTLTQWTDKRRVKKVAMWSREKGCELLIDLLRESKIRVEAVYDRVDRADDWRGIRLARFDSFDPSRVDGLAVGSLSCGVAEDLAADLVRRFPSLSVWCPVSWVSAGTETLAVSA
jgi:GT2 family glycosyltransferase